MATHTPDSYFIHIHVCTCVRLILIHIYLFPSFIRIVNVNKNKNIFLNCKTQTYIYDSSVCRVPFDSLSLACFESYSTQSKYKCFPGNLVPADDRPIDCRDCSISFKLRSPTPTSIIVPATMRTMCIRNPLLATLRTYSCVSSSRVTVHSYSVRTVVDRPFLD